MLVFDISEMDHDGEIASEVATTTAATEKKLEKPKSYKIPKKGVVASLVVAKQVKKVSKEIKHEKGDNQRELMLFGDNLDLEQDSDDQVDSFSDGDETLKVAEKLNKTQNEGAKGQLNSEWIYEVIVSPKMATKNFPDSCHGSSLESRTEIWKNFGCHFGRSNDLINSF